MAVPYFLVGLTLAIFNLYLFGSLQWLTRYGYNAALHMASETGWDAKLEPKFHGRLSCSVLPLLPLLALPLGMAAKRGRRTPGTVFAVLAPRPSGLRPASFREDAAVPTGPTALSALP